MRHFIFYSVFLLSFLFIITGQSNAESSIIDNGNGTFSMENGIFLRQYEGYSDESQQFLSVLDACWSMIGSYSEIIDPYISEEKSFDDDQWNVIDSEVRYMSGYACSWVMQNNVPKELKEYEDEIFYSAYHLLIGNDLILTALSSDDMQIAALATYHYTLADKGLEWWKK